MTHSYPFETITPNCLLKQLYSSIFVINSTLVPLENIQKKYIRFVFNDVDSSTRGGFRGGFGGPDPNSS